MTIPAPIAQTLSKAQSLAALQRLDDAIALLAPIDHPDCHYYRGGMLAVQKRFAEAETAFRSVLKFAPGHGESLMGLSTCLVEQGKGVQAIPTLRAILKAQPAMGRARYLLGIALDQAGKAREAGEELNKARAAVIAPAEKRGLNPWEIYIQLSRRCNLRCAMCGHEIWQSNSGFMDRPVFDRVLDQARAAGIDTIHVLSGQGEPLLHPQVFEMLEKAVAQGFKVGIVTNGTPLTPERITRLAGLGLAYIQLSFAGWDKESYESVYVGAKFDRTLENLKGLNAALPPGSPTGFAVKAVAAGDWKTTLERTKTFLSSHGIDRVFTVTANNFGGTVQCGQFFEKHGIWSLRGIEHHRRMPCRVFLKAVGIFCDGTVTACACYDSNAQLKIGNIMEQSLADIRQGAEFRRMLDGFRTGDLTGIPMCEGCDDPFG